MREHRTLRESGRPTRVVDAPDIVHPEIGTAIELGWEVVSLGEAAIARKRLAECYEVANCGDGGPQFFDLIPPIVAVEENYGLGVADMAANVNWFSKVEVDATGALSLVESHSAPGASLTLRFDMDTLVLMHTCPHPLNRQADYPAKPVQVELGEAEPAGEDDACRTFCPENGRGFRNNALYHLGRD